MQQNQLFMLLVIVSVRERVDLVLQSIDIALLFIVTHFGDFKRGIQFNGFYFSFRCIFALILLWWTLDWRNTRLGWNLLSFKESAGSLFVEVQLLVVTHLRRIGYTIRILLFYIMFFYLVDILDRSIWWRRRLILMNIRMIIFPLFFRTFFFFAICRGSWRWSRWWPWST